MPTSYTNFILWLLTFIEWYLISWEIFEIINFFLRACLVILEHNLLMLPNPNPYIIYYNIRAKTNGSTYISRISPTKYDTRISQSYVNIFIFHEKNILPWGLSEINIRFSIYFFNGNNKLNDGIFVFNNVIE